MATDHLQRREPAEYGDAPAGRAPRAPVTGPHAGYDRYGRLDHYYWRCVRCGLESTDTTLTDGCWRCASEEGR